MWHLILVHLLLMIIVVHITRAQFNRGRYKAVFESIAECPDYPLKSTASKWFFNATKINKTHPAYNIQGILTEDLDDLMIGHADVDKWGDGGWKHLISREDNNFLRAVSVLPPKFHSLLMDFLRIGDVTFPVKKGTYTWRKFVWPTNVFNETMLLGRFRLRFWITRFNIMHICAILISQFVPIYQFDKK